MPNVLVLDANQRSALAIIRSLGRHGLNVFAADTTARSLGGASRFALKSARYADPATSPDAFLTDLSALVEQLSIDTIIPATDLTTMLLVSQPTWSHFKLVAASRGDSYEALTDKARLVELAQGLDIPVPLTRIARSREEILAASQEIQFPLVLKPARSRYLKDGQVLSTGVEIVDHPARLDRVIERCRWLADIPCLVQRFVPGHGAGVFAAFTPSGPVAWFTHRRIREKPPGGGVSVLCESVTGNPDLQASAEKLLMAARWSGVAMVEFRIGEDGTPYLMEVNGRFWGSLQLAIDCGIDFPWILHQISQDRAIAPSPSYRSGRRLRWLLGDLDVLLLTLRAKPSTIGQKAVAIGRFLRSFTDRRCRQEIFRLSDPYPGIREIAQWLRAR